MWIFSVSKVYRSYRPTPLTAAAELSQSDLPNNIAGYLVTIQDQNSDPLALPIEPIPLNRNYIRFCFLKEMSVWRATSCCGTRALATSLLFSRTRCEQLHLRCKWEPAMVCCGLVETALCWDAGCHLWKGTWGSRRNKGACGGIGRWKQNPLPYAFVENYFPVAVRFTFTRACAVVTLLCIWLLQHGPRAYLLQG